MYGFYEFGKDLDNIIDKATSYQEITRNGSACMKELLKTPYLVDDNYLNSLLRGELHNYVYKSERNSFVVQVFVWESNTKTPVHDHLTWGIMGIYRNCLNVKEYSIVPIREGAYDVNIISEFNANYGDVCYLIPPDDEIHKIENNSNSLSVSIHVYGKDIKEYNIYDLENGEILHQIV